MLSDAYDISSIHKPWLTAGLFFGARHARPHLHFIERGDLAPRVSGVTHARQS